MQKILSARLDESALNDMDRATRKLGISKRQFLEEAIRLRVQGLAREGGTDVWADTLGAWRRQERPATSVREARAAFEHAFERHHRPRHARLHR